MDGAHDLRFFLVEFKKRNSQNYILGKCNFVEHSLPHIVEGSFKSHTPFPTTTYPQGCKSEIYALALTFHTHSHAHTKLRLTIPD